MATLPETTDASAASVSQIDEGQGGTNSQTLTLAAIENAKREGLLLAVRARWAALAVIAVLVPFLNPNWEVLYYIALIGLFTLVGWAQLKVGKTGRSRLELFLMFCDLALMTIVTVVPNPWRAMDWPTAMQYRFDNFIYFFVFSPPARWLTIGEPWLRWEHGPQGSG